MLDLKVDKRLVILLMYLYAPTIIVSCHYVLYIVGKMTIEEIGASIAFAVAIKYLSNDS